MSDFFLSKEGRERLQRMSNMVRFNNEVHLHSENVAEHSFYVATYAICICDKIGIDGRMRSKIVERAVLHDISETDLSDIPHNVKHSVPGLVEYFEAYEKRFNQEHFPNSYEEEQWRHEEIINIIVEIADILSVIQYASQENEIGNKKLFGPILATTKDRLKECLERLKTFVPAPHRIGELERLILESEV